MYNNFISRNNTSFIKNTFEILKSIQTNDTDILKHHQKLVHDYLLYNPHIRGILAYHEMGSGKTLLAVSICDTVIKKKLYKKIFFISAKTLHENFLNDYKKYLKMIHDPISESESDMDLYIKKNCKLITLTANNMIDQINRAYEEDSYLDLLNIETVKKHGNKSSFDESLNNSLVMIDEVHNFLNGITNGSENYVGLYKKLMNAKNIKILELSGSPIINDPFEIILGFNILIGYEIIKNKNKNKTELITLFGEDYDDFTRYFINNSDLLDLDQTVLNVTSKTPTIKNKEKFSNRIVGLISYYGTNQNEIKKLFPKLEELIINKIPMSTKQYSAYSAARDKEQEESRKNIFKSHKILLQKPQSASSSYRVRSRQISNFLYPDYAINSYKDDKGYLISEKQIDKLDPSCFDYNGIGLETWSPKFIQLLVNISIHLPKGMLDSFKKLSETEKWKPTLLKKNLQPGIGPGIIYSQFIDSGIGLLGKILEYYKFKEIKNFTDIETINNQPVKFGTFAIISGETSIELRSEIVKLTMSQNNKKAEILSLLLITSTGAEGISTKFMRHVHAIEPFWNWSRISQVFARAARLGSHIELPEIDKTVQPYLYLSDYPEIFEDEEQKKIKNIEYTTDITLYYKSMQNQLLINTFLNVLKESSIDCLIYQSSNIDKINQIKCKICSPTNEPLFINDIQKDMLSPSPCKELIEEKIKAKSIILDDHDNKEEYMYYIGDNIIHILKYNSNLNAYKEIFEDDPNYSILKNKIETKIK